MKIKYIINIIFVSALLFSTGLIFGQADSIQYHSHNEITYGYSRPAFSEPFKKIIPDYKEYYHYIINKDMIWPAIITLSSTAILVYYDQDLLDVAKRIGEELNISSKDETATFLSIADIALFRGPTDMGSTMYFIGDGWFQGSILASFLTYGLIKDDNRALQTASQLTEGLITSGIATQILKHITGRQSPYRSTEDGGRWDLFPDQIEYHKHVPSYDAYPSGHLATAMMTYTVITENYPEYNYWVKPVSWTLMTLLSYQMMNNGVHWASDYPLAIAIGYGFGKIAVRNGRALKTSKTDNKLSVFPMYKEEAFGLSFIYSLD